MLDRSLRRQLLYNAVTRLKSYACVTDAISQLAVRATARR